MKIQFKGKMANIERASAESIVVKFARTHGKVIEGGEKLAPNAKETEMAMEFAMRPALADGLRIGQTLTITIETAPEDEP